MKGFCQICGRYRRLYGFIKFTSRGLVKLLACEECIRRFT